MNGTTTTKTLLTDVNTGSAKPTTSSLSFLVMDDGSSSHPIKMNDGCHSAQHLFVNKQYTLYECRICNVPTLRRCSKCYVDGVFYCSIKCQETDANNHYLREGCPITAAVAAPAAAAAIPCENVDMKKGRDTEDDFRLPIIFLYVCFAVNRMFGGDNHHHHPNDKHIKYNKYNECNHKTKTRTHNVYIIC